MQEKVKEAFSIVGGWLNKKVTVHVWVLVAVAGVSLIAAAVLF